MNKLFVVLAAAVLVAAEAQTYFDYKVCTSDADCIAEVQYCEYQTYGVGYWYCRNYLKEGDFCYYAGSARCAPGLQCKAYQGTYTNLNYRCQ
ncbi:hypothetical protein JTE90_011841 [Oedothorax gibbosus]|uniref:Uncharacterized protein n=1 Tax=Oedothorax gibbosus TaxID=931172 RepID=A0AAV6U1V0_9ARAC|nr:hypothetical protein JTE90_011841 [Oedothorax gibbosus]